MTLAPSQMACQQASQLQGPSKRCSENTPEKVERALYSGPSLPSQSISSTADPENQWETLPSAPQDPGKVLYLVQFPPTCSYRQSSNIGTWCGTLTSVPQDILKQSYTQLQFLQPKSGSSSTHPGTCGTNTHLCL